MLVRTGVLMGRFLRRDIRLGLYGCVGVHLLKEHSGKREKHEQDKERRGPVGQRSVFSH